MRETEFSWGVGGWWMVDKEDWKRRLNANDVCQFRSLPVPNDKFRRSARKRVNLDQAPARTCIRSLSLSPSKAFFILRSQFLCC
jgi:hypothetical protein